MNFGGQYTCCGLLNISTKEFCYREKDLIISFDEIISIIFFPCLEAMYLGIYQATSFSPKRNFIINSVFGLSLLAYKLVYKLV